jgi:hypothetical protein
VLPVQEDTNQIGYGKKYNNTLLKQTILYSLLNKYKVILDIKMKNCCKYIEYFKVSGLWNQRLTSNAAEKGHLYCLKYAHENGCSWHQYTTLVAAQNGHLDCLKYAHENKCPWHQYTTSHAHAAQNGQLDSIKYAHENECPWSQGTTLNAAENGHLDCLKYAHEHGCPWNEDTTSYAAYNGHLDCLKFSHENGCPLNEQLTLSNLQTHSSKIDLDDKWWRSFLFEKDLTTHLILKKLVHTKKEEIKNLQEKSTLLFSYISKDLTKYVLWTYL